MTTAAGAIIGHQRGLADHVSVEQVPYAETVPVPLGSHTQHGCYDYHGMGVGVITGTAGLVLSRLIADSH